MSRRDIAIELINGVLKRPDLAQHLRVRLVIRKLEMMAYKIGSETDV